MDALPQTSTAPRRRRAHAALLLCAPLIVGAAVSTACSSNSKPKALPPQTMAPKPPEVTQPVSNAPQEMEIEQIPTPTEGTSATGASPAGEQPTATAEPDAATRGMTLEGTTVQSPDSEPNPTVMVIEPADSGGSESSETSLFEAAQAERERRETSGESTLVLTNKTLKQYSKGNITYLEGETPEGASAEGDATGVTVTPESAEPGEEAETGGTEMGEAESSEDEAEALWQKEQYWRNRVLDLRVAWRESLDRIGELEQEIATLRRDFYAEDDPFYRDSQIKPAWDLALEQLEDSKRAVERHEKELDEALTEGRREGALPGWLREGIELEPTRDELAETLEEPGEFHEPSEPVIVDEDDGGPRVR